MKAKEFIPASKPRNFVAKNQKTAGACPHKDKKKAEKQGDVKHKGKPMDEAAHWYGGASHKPGWSGSGRRRDPEDWDEGNTEPPNNFAIYINGKKWKVFKGRGYYADDERERAHYYQLKDWARKKSEATGKKWEVSITGEPATD